MLATILAFFKAVSSLWDLFNYIRGAISLEQYNSSLRNISKAVDGAKSGSLEDRLKAGKDLQDEINKHT